ncbi:MAG: hypothetical protein JSR18_01830 [Proteobacteria bacterium]|nr:hypothetical protein [Pseudomonadota bacterium]
MSIAPPARARTSRRTLYLIALVCLAPIVGSTIVYFFFPRASFTNYGTLLAVQPAPAIHARAADGKAVDLAALHGHWVVVVAGGGACDASCEARLYATRQARTMQGRERERVERVWLVTDDVPPSPAVLADHPDLVVWRADGPQPAWPQGREAIYLVDPLGNQVLAWPADPDIKKLAKDIEKLLRASRIG